MEARRRSPSIASATQRPIRMSPSTTAPGRGSSAARQVRRCGPGRSCRGRRPRAGPSSTSWSTMVEPMVPAPPVTSTRCPSDHAVIALQAGRSPRRRRPGSGDAASRISSTRRPASPSVSGARRSRIAAANSATTPRERLAPRERRAPTMSPIRYEMSASRRRRPRPGSRPSRSTPLSYRLSRCDGFEVVPDEHPRRAADDHRADLGGAQPVDVRVGDRAAVERQRQVADAGPAGADRVGALGGDGDGHAGRRGARSRGSRGRAGRGPRTRRRRAGRGRG